jgi:LPS-assembly lipoprotein
MRHLLLILTLTMIASCGWHLRGVTPLPEGYRIVHLSGYENTDLHQTLAGQLRFNGAVVTSSAGDAPVLIVLSEYDVEKRTLSVNSLGQVSEYELNGYLTADIERQLDGQKHQITVHARRTLQNDVNNVVATQQEEQTLRADLDSDLRTRLLRRLQKLEQP